MARARIISLLLCLVLLLSACAPGGSGEENPTGSRPAEIPEKQASLPDLTRYLGRVPSYEEAYYGGIRTEYRKLPAVRGKAIWEQIVSLLTGPEYGFTLLGTFDSDPDCALRFRRCRFLCRGQAELLPLIGTEQDGKGYHLQLTAFAPEGAEDFSLQLHYTQSLRPQDTGSRIAVEIPGNFYDFPPENPEFLYIGPPILPDLGIFYDCDPLRNKTYYHPMREYTSFDMPEWDRTLKETLELLQRPEYCLELVDSSENFDGADGFNRYFFRYRGPADIPFLETKYSDVPCHVLLRFAGFAGDHFRVRLECSYPFTLRDPGITRKVTPNSKDKPYQKPFSPDPAQRPAPKEPGSVGEKPVLPDPAPYFGVTASVGNRNGGKQRECRYLPVRKVETMLIDYMELLAQPRYQLELTGSQLHNYENNHYCMSCYYRYTGDKAHEALEDKDGKKFDAELTFDLWLSTGRCEIGLTATEDFLPEDAMRRTSLPIPYRHSPYYNPDGNDPYVPNVPEFSKRDCPSCHGSGDCPNCGGSGYIDKSGIHGPSRSPCNQCMQSGRCRRCGGTGKID